jgi:branched-chain amino acid transport system ATP-binding protein
MLKVQDLHVYYGGIHALKGISIDVPRGRIVTLIGANGAGKSSTLRAIAGLIKNKKGTITYNGADLSKLGPVEVVKSGIVMSPEGRRIFPHLTVLENLRLGAYSRSDAPQVGKDIDWICDLFPKLRERKDQKGGTLSGGEQQMLALGRALMSAADVVMMDEPSLGLAPMLERGLRHHRRHQPAGQNSPAGGAERLCRPQDRPLCLCAGGGRYRAAGFGRGAHCRRPGARGLSGRIGKSGNSLPFLH